MDHTAPDTPVAGSTPDRGRRWLAVAIVLGAVLFAARGVWRATDGAFDLPLMYAAARTWLTGGNPYAAADQAATLAAADPQNLAPARSFLQSLYPPTALVVLAPLGAIPSWHAANLAWLALNVALIPVILAGVLRIAQVDWRSRTAAALVAATLALAPVQLAVATGQTTLPVVALVVLSALAGLHGRAKTAGVLLALAIALKPQLAGVFLLYLAIRRQWKALATCAIGLVVLAGASLIPAGMRDFEWVRDLRFNWAWFAVEGGLGDPSPAAVNRFHLLHLPVLLRQVLPSTDLAEQITWALAAVAACSVVLWARRTRSTRYALLELSTLAVLALLACYHRAYDAAILVLPLAWALANVSGPARRTAWAVLVLLAVFLTPGGPMLEVLATRGWIPPAVTAGWWWTGVILPHQVWALLGLQVLLLLELRRESTPLTA